MKNYLIVFSAIFLLSCTKYVANNTGVNSGNSNNSSSGSGSGSFGSGSTGGGSTSGGSGSSTGSGGSSSGSSGGGSTGGSSGTGTGSGGSSTGTGSGSSTGSGGSSTGTGTGSSSSSSTNPTYMQLINYVTQFSPVSGLNFYADSVLLNSNSSYTTVKSGTTVLKVNNTNYSAYNLLPNNFYSAIFFYKPFALNGGIAETLLFNGTNEPAVNRAFVRFINIDLNTYNNNTFQNYFFESYADTVRSFNRKYLDHQQDSSFTIFRDVYATTATLTVKNNNNQVISQFQYPFLSKKKYTIFSFPESNTNIHKIYIAQHN